MVASRRRAGAAPGQAQLPLPGQALRQADAGGRRGRGAAQPPTSSAGSSGASRPSSTLDGERVDASCPRTWPSSARWRATGWCRATARTWWRSIRRSTEELRAGGARPRGGEPDPAAPEGSGYEYTDRIGLWIDGAEPVLDARARRTRDSSRARRWRGGWSSAAGRRRPTWSRRSDIDGHGGDGGSATITRTAGTGPVHNPGMGNEQEAARRTSRSDSSRSGPAS